MGFALTIIRTQKDREEAMLWVTKAPIGTRIELRGPKRSKEQSDKMWAMLTDIVKAGKTINDRKLTTEEWKVVFLQALGHEPDVLPTLDGKGFFSLGYSSSKLSKEEMSDLIEYIYAWGAENSMVWSDPELASYQQMARR
ncbi:hypothetical protein ABIB86_000405 [Bradyrhizobium sp. JR1.7]|uniref:recombination protein NinB n=1 Tax=unclassified Bradyrhizobium TaxID=2631580 RepID=UPI0033970387